LQRLHAAEQDQLKTLSLLADAAADPAIQEALRNHLAETEGQVRRLEQILEQIGVTPDGRMSKAADGLREDALEMTAFDADNEVVDLEVVASGQKMEHFEIACYMTAKEMAQALGMEEAAQLLQQTLAEEERSSRLLAQASRKLLRVATDSEMDEVEAEEDVESEDE
jgi:ferritin-like metal-binding protein YciE